MPPLFPTALTMRPQIPDRTSSKRPRVELETEREQANIAVKKLRKNLKPQASFSSAFWVQNAEIAMNSKRAVSLHTEISEQLHEEQGLPGDFSQTEKAISLRERFNALESEERLFKEQAELLNTESAHMGGGGSRRRAFIELFTTSRLGLGIATGRGRRDSSVQSKFRADCIIAYNSANPDPKREFLWCPILKTWTPQSHAIAAHIFAYMHGQDVMHSIFGVIDPPELFSPRNGMIISDLVEAKLDKGFMVVVPDLPDRPTPAQVQRWSSLKTKEYKVRILDLNDPEVYKVIKPGSDQTWKDLDGQRLEFRGDYRPRARYLYFHHCIQILRRAWKAERSAAEQMSKEFKAGFWGTRGSYVPGSMLRAFIEELGHGYEELSEGAKDDSATRDSEENPFLVTLVSRQVTAKQDKGEDDDDDDDDDDDEEWYDEDEDEERGGHAELKRQ